MSNDLQAEAISFVVQSVSELGVSLFIPATERSGLDLVVRETDGAFVEVDIKAASDSNPVFSMGHFRPRPSLFVVGILFKNNAPVESWVLPSGIFDRFASHGNAVVLDMQADDGGETLSDRLAIYRDKWQLISEYSKYRSTLSDPIALQVRMALG